MGKMKDLPQNIKQYIEEQGKDLADGYIRFLSGEEIEQLYEQLHKSSVWNGGIPFASTVFADILAWEDGYIMLYKLTEEDYTVMLSGTEFFFQNLEDAEYQADFLDLELYHVARRKLGRVENGQCYTLEPLPRLGGAREEKYLNVGDMKSYIQLLL